MADREDFATEVGELIKGATDRIATLERDTGWIPLPIADTSFTSGVVKIRRKGHVVTLKLDNVEMSGITDTTQDLYLTPSFFIPVGYRPENAGDRPSGLVIGAAATNVAIIAITNSHRVNYIRNISGSLGTGAKAGSGEITWHTSQPFPA